MEFGSCARIWENSIAWFGIVTEFILFLLGLVGFAMVNFVMLSSSQDRGVQHHCQVSFSISLGGVYGSFYSRSVSYQCRSTSKYLSLHCASQKYIHFSYGRLISVMPCPSLSL
jgi:hypothetical protein